MSARELSPVIESPIRNRLSLDGSEWDLSNLLSPGTLGRVNISYSSIDEDQYLPSQEQERRVRFQIEDDVEENEEEDLNQIWYPKEKDIPECLDVDEIFSKLSANKMVRSGRPANRAVPSKGPYHTKKEEDFGMSRVPQRRQSLQYCPPMAEPLSLLTWTARATHRDPNLTMVWTIRLLLLQDRADRGEWTTVVETEALMVDVLEEGTTATGGILTRTVVKTKIGNIIETTVTINSEEIVIVPGITTILSAMTTVEGKTARGYHNHDAGYYSRRTEDEESYYRSRNDGYGLPPPPTRYDDRFYDDDHDDHSQEEPAGHYSPRFRRREREPDTRTMVEIVPGQFVPLRGSGETWQAIKTNNVAKTTCSCCSIDLMCIADADMVMCPSCMVISPVISGPGGGGLGLGMSVGDAERELNLRR